MQINELLHRIQRRLLKLRLQPIRVFCFHQVSEEYEPLTMWKCDWMQIDEFKSKIQKMQQDGEEFISLKEAYEHICNDNIRCKRYAVLTFDDGWASLKEILPWLEGQRIPVTLFINGKYLDGKSYRKNPNEKYLTKEELFTLTSPLIEIGSHGWEHKDASKIRMDEFKETIEQNIALLHTHPCYIPFHAYTWGKHTDASNKLLEGKNIIPVLIDGMKNYNEYGVIHRQLL